MKRASIKVNHFTWSNFYIWVMKEGVCYNWHRSKHKNQKLKLTTTRDKL